MSFHGALAKVQRHMAWKESSRSTEHNGQPSLTSKFLESLMSQVGSKFEESFQAKTLTFGGANLAQTRFHIDLSPLGEELKELWAAWLFSSNAIRCALRTIKLSDFSPTQAMKLQRVGSKFLFSKSPQCQAGEQYLCPKHHWCPLARKPNEVCIFLLVKSLYEYFHGIHLPHQILTCVPFPMPETKPLFNNWSPWAMPCHEDEWFPESTVSSSLPWG